MLKNSSLSHQRSTCYVLLYLLTAITQLHSAELVSVNSAGTASARTNADFAGSSVDLGFSDRFLPERISESGRFVVFSSGAPDLVRTDTNDADDVFMRDVVSRTTTLISANQTGTSSGRCAGCGNLTAGNALISANGRFVVFQSTADDLVTGDTNSATDIFIRDTVNSTTELISVNSGGTASANSYSFDPAISSDAQFVAFESIANDLVANDNNGLQDVFVRDRSKASTTLVSINRAGTGSGNGMSQDPVVSGDGRFVVFVSVASDLVEDDGNGVQDVFVRDLVAGTTTLVSVNRAGTASGNGPSRATSMSANGRYVVFLSRASNLASTPDTNNAEDVFVRDLVGRTTHLVSINVPQTAAGNDQSGEPPRTPGISAGGRYVVFTSRASDLVANDTNATQDVFVRDLATATTILVSVNSAGLGSANDFSGDPVISRDGQTVAFVSFATNLVSTPVKQIQNVYARNIQTGMTKLLSENNARASDGNAPSGNPKISADGRRVAFDSRASDLVTLTKSHRNVDVFFADVP